MAIRNGLNDIRLTDSRAFGGDGIHATANSAAVDELVQRAGLGWEAKTSPVLFEDDAGIQQAPGRKVIYRSDNRAPLAVVSDRFQVVQPRDVIEFYRDLTERHGFTLTKAGAVKGGKIIYAKAETGDIMRVHGNDVLKGYVLLSTSFDGSLATTARFSTLRLVCMNGLTVGEDLAPVVRVSDRTSLGFVVETERQVEAHLASHLDRLPAADSASRAIVAQMKDDEARHADAALHAGGVALPAPVRGLMRLAAKVMTVTAHRI